MEEVQKELHQSKKTIENLEADLKLHSRLKDRVSQDKSYIIADIERAEKELEFANRKIKQLDDVAKKLKVENEQLKNAKKGLADDLQKLMNKRQDIENLQATLMGIMQHAGNKKIDVSDLKSKLAEGVKRDKSAHSYSSQNAEITLKRKKSQNADLQADEASNAATLKMNEDSTPAWYKSLKKNIV